VLWFVRLKLSDKIVVARDVATKLTGNSAFPTPKPAPAEITASADAADTAMQEASGGDRVKIAVRNEKDSSLTQTLRDVVAYVQGNCGNNEANVLSAGLRVRKTRTPAGLCTAPQDLRLGYTGMTGELLLRLKAVKHKLTYTIQQSESADGPYVTVATSSSGRKVLTGFTPGKTYWIRACANGTAGPGPYSTPVCAMAV
jgi:hypothetical protein